VILKGDLGLDPARSPRQTPFGYQAKFWYRREPINDRMAELVERDGDGQLKYDGGLGRHGPSESVIAEEYLIDDPQTSRGTRMLAMVNGYHERYLSEFGVFRIYPPELISRGRMVSRQASMRRDTILTW
jgi:hypothetical protein